ncbi:hypothetical protein VNO78_11132 [Psophocarpus tetragonolobus]|uniref:Cullin-4 n=1 Tax=Psophocarpus tetragonolobus TaxID=3891 RepID=A0AAN9SKY1_PSOTE
MGGNLYQRIEKECEAHISAALQSLVGQSPDLIVFLSLVERCWQDLCDQMLMIRGIALYLDRIYVKQTANVQSLWDMGLQLFRKHLSLSPEVEHKTVTGVLRMFGSERNQHSGLRELDWRILIGGLKWSSCQRWPFLSGESVDRTLLNHLLKMFSALGIYAETFEKPFLVCSSEFYAAEGMKYMQQSDAPDYLKHVETRLQEEHERCLICLDATTRKPLIATAEKQLLERHIPAILDKGFTMLMDGNRIEDLPRMYSLFSRVNALESLRQALSSYIKRTGQFIVMDEEKDKDMVSSLLEFKASLDKIWEESFFKNEAFSNTTKDAFEYLVNLRQNQPAELIAKFLDEKLQAGNKGTSEEELEATLDKVLVLFRFIQGTDVFEAFYKKRLAKRLLLGKSASIDVEKSMISKLKTECGSQFTNKLEGMFKDIELSKEINESFKQSSQARSKPASGIEMSVHVLTTGLVLMLFNDAEKLSLQDIKDATGIEDKEVRRTLQSLACGKVRVLQKTPKGRDVEDDDSFDLVMGLQLLFTIDAAIVRIMKTRKVLSHTLLITELFQQLKFPIKPADLKKRIGSLIDREYLESDKSNPQIYNYLA